MDAVLVILATVLTAAAGNVINDIFDIEEDLINNPEKRIIAQKISIKNGHRFYYILLTLSIITGYFSSWTMFALCIAIGVLLYFYSSDIKGETLWGNLLIAFMCGAVVFTADLGVYTRNEGYFAEYALLSFLITMPREIIKDIIDLPGDRAQGYETFPIVFGEKRSTHLATVFMLMIAGVVAYIMITDGNLKYNIYTSICVLLPCVFIIVKLQTARVIKDYTELSNYLKMLMILGLFSVIFL